MGIDYVVALDCPPKEALTVEGIVEMIKARSRADVVLRMARENGDERPPSAITFAVQLMRSGQVETHDVSVGSLFERARPLETHQASCQNCPVSRGRPYGCYDSIAYPIEPETEQWLLARLPESLRSPAGVVLERAFGDFGWDGAQAAAMRAQGDTFFRLDTAPVRRWSSGLAISGDQLFHMMFHVGHIGAGHAMMLALFFGLIALDDDAPPAPPLPDTRNAAAMAGFLNTLALASQNKVDVLIDA